MTLCDLFGGADLRKTPAGLIIKNTAKTAIVYKIVFVGIIFVSSILTNVDLPWNISDTFNGLMMVPNLIGVLALAPLVVKITNNYARRSFKNSGETPMYSAFEEIQSAQEAAEKESL